MFRFAMALLITTSLLVCPLRCQLHAYAADSENAVVVAVDGCGCCHSQSQSVADWQSEQSPDGKQCPDGDCDCSGCICEGAVVELHDSLDASSPDVLAVFIGAAVPYQPTVSMVQRRQRDQLMPHGGRFLNGRAARLSQHSLLI